MDLEWVLDTLDGAMDVAEVLGDAAIDTGTEWY
jgi:hypothetical protein